MRFRPCIILFAVVASAMIGCSSKQEPNKQDPATPSAIQRPVETQRQKDIKAVQRILNSTPDYTKQETPFDFSTEFKQAVKKLGVNIHSGSVSAVKIAIPQDYSVEEFLKYGNELTSTSKAPRSKAELPVINIYGDGWAKVLQELPLYDKPFAIKLSVASKPEIELGPFLEKQVNLKGVQLTVADINDFNMLFQLKPPADLIHLSFSCFLERDINYKLVDAIGRFPKLRSVSLGNLKQLDSTTLNAIAGLSDLEMLELRSCNELKTDCFEQIARCKLLKYLNLASTKIVYSRREKADYVALAKLTELEYFDLGSIALSNDFALKMKGLSKLKAFKVQGNFGALPIQDDGLITLSQLPELEGLSLAKCASLTNNGYESLFRCATLEVISLSEVHALTGKGIKSIGQLKQLRQLTLWYDNSYKPIDAPDSIMHSESWAGIAELDQLGYLSIKSDGLTADAIRNFCSDLPNLEELRLILTGTQPEDENYDGNEILKAIAQLPKINTLYLSFGDPATITDEGFNALAQKPSMLNIEVYGSGKSTSVTLEAVNQFLGDRAALNPTTEGKLWVKRKPLVE